MNSTTHRNLIKIASFVVFLGLFGCDHEPTEMYGSDLWRCEHQNPSERFDFRFTAVRFTEPYTLADQILLRAGADNLLDSFELVWLASIDRQPLALTLGSGYSINIPPSPGVDEEFCHVTWNSASLEYAARTSTLEQDGDMLSTASPFDELINLPIYSEDNPSEPIAVIPVRHTEVRIILSENSTLVGLPPEDLPGPDMYAGRWQIATCDDGSWVAVDYECERGEMTPQGWIGGWVTVRESRKVGVIYISLCGLLAGPSSDDCNAPEEKWEVPPTAMPGSGEDAFWLELIFGAGAVVIDD